MEEELEYLQHQTEVKLDEILGFEIDKCEDFENDVTCPKSDGSVAIEFQDKLIPGQFWNFPFQYVASIF